MKILLIENNDDDAVLFAISAKSLAVSITHVPNAMEAAHRLSDDDQLPDLIVLDLILPGMTARDFLNWVSAKPAIKKIPIVIFTGALAVEDEVNEVKSMVRATYYKSPSIFEMKRMVREMCRFAASE